MKKAASLLAVLTIILIRLSAQTSFNGPESVEYDAAHNRWLVGNKNNGTVVAYYPQSNLTQTFCSGMNAGPHGIEIAGNTLYCCSGNSIKGFDLNSGSQVFSVTTNATFLNGITTDGSAYLFATDFTGGKIYRISITSQSYNVMVSGLPNSPNGIYYDGTNNRCVFVTWGGSAKVSAMSLADSSISTLYTTSYSNFDGITKDQNGYWYVSCWSNNSLLRFDPAFSNVPVTLMTGLSSPADIDINVAGDSIGIPNSSTSSNNVVFYVLSTSTGIQATPKDERFKVYPNPADDPIFVLCSDQHATQLEIMDSTGKRIDLRPISSESISIDVSGYKPGLYFIRFYDNGRVAHTEKFNVVK